ncbi:MAG TPA: hypothetical protein VJN18_20855 [Polyangiaceae bacterium]|nr:hypothetical protein [Polyangiaceae bacterium]
MARPKGVTCGDDLCEVGKEKCCPAPAPKCVRINEPFGSAAHCPGGGAWLCDDRLDCGPTEVCCWDHADSETTYTTCRARCGAEACREDSDCEGGATCSKQAAEPGTCAKTSRPAGCTSKKDCGSRADCCFSALDGGTSCRSDCETFNLMTVCEQAGECPPTRFGAKGRAGCLPASTSGKGSPVRLKTCQYADR